MRHLRNLLFFVLGISIAAMSLFAFADNGPLVTGQKYGVNGNAIVGSSPSNAPITTTYYEVDKVYVSNSSATDVTVRREIPINIMDRSSTVSARLVEAVKVEKPMLRAAAMAMARRGARGPWGIAASIVAAELVSKGWEWMEEAQRWMREPPPKSDLPRPDDKVSCYYTQWEMTSFQNCRNLFEKAAMEGDKTTYSVRRIGASNSYWIIATRPTYGDFQLATFVKPTDPGKPEKEAVPRDEVDRAAEAVANSNPKGVAQDIIDVKEPVTYEPIERKFDGSPQSQPRTSTSTQNNPDGSSTKTTQTETDYFNVDDNKIKKDTKTDTTTETTDKDGNKSTSHSSSSNTNKEPDPPPVWKDADMPNIAELYKQKYPEGVKGVWERKQEAFKQTAFMKSLGTLVPSISNGSCPSFSINTNNGWANGGMQTIPVPCWVYSFIRAIVLLTAAFVARRIIFGG